MILKINQVYTHINFDIAVAFPCGTSGLLHSWASQILTAFGRIKNLVFLKTFCDRHSRTSLNAVNNPRYNKKKDQIFLDFRVFRYYNVYYLFNAVLELMVDSYVFATLNEVQSNPKSSCIRRNLIFNV